MNHATLRKLNVIFTMKVSSILILLITFLQAQDRSSIHQLELEYYKENFDQEKVIDNVVNFQKTYSNQALNRTVFGYHPYWKDTSWVKYDFSLLSTIAYFGAEANASGGIDSWNGWPPNNLISEAHSAGVEVVLTVTLFNSNYISSLLSNETYRQNLITTLVNSVSSAGADGVNIDFEGLPSSQKENMVQFTTDLKNAFNTAIPGSQVTLATPAVDWSGAWDYDVLAGISDGLMIMAYDYHWSNAPTTGPVAPLTGWGTYNVTWTINDYLTWSGGLNDKLILGCPYYGYDWPAESSEAGAVVDSTGSAKSYSIAEPSAISYGKIRDNDSQSPWYRYQDSGWHQCWYDDSLSLSLKYDLVNQFDLQGVGIWALGYDGDQSELWGALEDKFTSNVGIDNETVLPSNIHFLSVYPNPFNSTTTIRFSVENPSHDLQHVSSLKVYDLKGRLVETLIPENMKNGVHEIKWNASNYPTGIYFISLSNGSEKVIQKISFIK